MSMLIVGTVATDDIATPFASVEGVLGGSAVYAATAGSLYVPVQIVGVIGADFPEAYLDFLKERQFDIEGLEIQEGKTFHWAGKYHFDMNTRDTLATELNVLATFNPTLPASYRNTPYVFLANVDPVIQLSALDQMEKPRLTILDTMNYWIETQRDDLTAVIRRTDLVMINDEELRQYTDQHSLLKAARAVLELGPRALIVKKGEHGAALVTKDGYYFAPGYPLDDVVDPTGAGDSFAGGFLGYIAKTESITPRELHRALIHGSVIASYTVEDFSVNRLKNVSAEDVQARYRDFASFTHFERLD
jgi:sugar/nucleoside kinase (ribokinase family)